MKILITGATGLVGNEVVSLLLQNGETVHYLTTSKKKIESQSNYKGFYWNPEQGIIDDAIIHLAGANIGKRWTENYKQEIIESRILSSNLLFKALKDFPHQVKQIVSASAVGIYPDDLKKCYSEMENEVDDSFLGNVVLKWEESIDKFQMLNLKVCKLRTGLVLSNKGGALMAMLKPIQYGIGAPFGSGRQVQSWIHIHDLAEMYYFAVRNGWQGVFNAVAPKPVTNKELTQEIAAVAKRPILLPFIPKFLVKLFLGEKHIMLFTSQKVSSQKASDNGFVFKYKFIDKALVNLLA
jgi:uncharacterized protein (TIGR01777 family)